MRRSPRRTGRPGCRARAEGRGPGRGAERRLPAAVRAGHAQQPRGLVVVVASRVQDHAPIVHLDHARREPSHERAVVRHHDHGPGILHQRLLQHLLAGDIEMMGGLVEQHEVRGFHQDARQRHPLPLAARQHAAGLEHVVAGEQEVAEQRAQYRTPVGRRDLLQLLEHRRGPGQRLRGVLGEVGEPGVRPGLAHPAAHRELARDHPQQRGLAGAVRAHDRDLVALRDLDGGVREHVAGVVAERGVAELHQQPAGVRGRREREADRARRPGEDDALGLQAIDHLDLAAGLRGLGVLRAKPFDEPRELGDALVELLVLGLELLAPELALHEVARERHGVGGQHAAVQLHDLVGDAVQEHAVVRHHHEPAPEVPEVVLQPFHRWQVEMVRGLVQEQERGVGQQQRRERRSHAPAARELGERAILIGAGEP